VIQRELEIAKQQLTLKNHHAARLALAKKKYQEQLLEKTGNQLLTIEQLCGTIEYALVEQEIVSRLEQGTKVLNQIHNEMSLEKVEKIMEDTQDAIEYQNEIQDIMSREFTPEDEEDIMAQLDELIEQEVNRISHRPEKSWVYSLLFQIPLF
jgi:charged multivesicular body protein 6